MISGAEIIVPRRQVTVEPAVEPVPIDDIRTHLRVTGTADDPTLAGYLRAARRYIEEIQGRAFLTQTRTLALDAFPEDDGPIELPGAPLASISSIAYTLEDGSSATVDASTYHTDTQSMPGRAVLKVDEEWPDDDLVAVNGVLVTYVAGAAPVTATVTISSATPAVVTWSSHGLPNGSPVSFATTSALPTGLTAERTYYVAQAASGTFQLAASPGGSSIATSSAGSGTHTATSVWRVPSTIIHAIKLLVGHLFENREATTEAALREVPLALQTLIDIDRIWSFA